MKIISYVWLTMNRLCLKVVEGYRKEENTIFLFIMAELDKNRNRLIALLGNCAKVLSSRKDATDETMSLVLKIRKLEKYLRNNTYSLDTVTTVYAHNKDLLSALDSFRRRDVPLSKEVLKNVDNIIQEGVQILEKESSVSFNSIEYLFKLKVKTEKDIKDTERKIDDLKSKNEGESSEAAKLVRRLKTLNIILNELVDKISKKELQQDEVKELNKKISPLTSAFDSSIKLVEVEKDRLVTTYKTYKFFIWTVIFVLIGWETYLVGNIYPKLPSTDWRVYISFYLPIPISAGLLWAFIYQMNKAQRLLIKSAQYIHKLKYKDSLLKASTEIYSDGLRNEEHVAKLIDNIMNEQCHPDKDAITEDKTENQYLSIDNIVELIKAFTGK